ncbi:UNVERIFIED_CONTAM: hypothetical protein Slati_0043200 [Sesamum latifolium]|uniref:DUF4283 domain-containing protein n=1 Tax=Sesamum latifolium TaxID=2727402 RepID=A0AAW2Y7H3_9LAMI
MKDGLSTVASGIGKLLYPDTITKACTRLDFARVCVMLDISLKLPKYVIIMLPKEDGSEVTCKVDVEYEWLPPKCNTCISLGHPTKACPLSKPTKPTVNVYVQRAKKPSKPRGEPATQPEPRPMDVESGIPMLGRANSGSVDLGQPRVERGDNGKEIILYNTFDALMSQDDNAECSSRGPNSSNPYLCLMINALVFNIRGLNRRDHQVAISDLIVEFQLHFIGLLETKASARNITRVQMCLSHTSKWFEDYTGPGTRIWLAWKYDEVDVEILTVHAQMIHYWVFIQQFHTTALVSIVSRANDLGERRGLWQSLTQLTDSIEEDPWLVMGASGNIRMAMEEFQECITATSLITLSMQGQVFTWHNCSNDSHSLWKQLDRMMVNDRWLDR